MLVSVITTSFFQPYVWKDPTLDVYILLVLLGICAFITQSLMTFALQKAEASIVSPYNYTGIIWAIIIDLAIWNVYPLTNTIVGGIIITISGIYIFRRETKRSVIPDLTPPTGVPPLKELLIRLLFVIKRLKSSSTKRFSVVEPMIWLPAVAEVPCPLTNAVARTLKAVLVCLSKTS